MRADAARKMDGRIPRIDGYPFIGVVPHFFTAPFEFLENISLCHPGQVVRLNMGITELLYSAHPEHVQHVLSSNWKNFSKGPIVKPLKLLVGEGLVTSDVDIWLRSRRVMQPVFNANQMAALAEPMIATIAEAINSLERLAGQEIDLGQELMQITQSVMLRVMFGTDTSPEQRQAVWESLDTALRAIHIRMFLYFLPSSIPLPGSAALKKSVQRIDEIILDIVKKRRQSGERRNDLLSLLLAAKDDETSTGMDDRQLRDELVTAFIAGIESTAMTLSWLFYLLSKNPEPAGLVQAEIQAVLGNRQPRFEDLTSLTYTRMAFMEVMRLYPPAWFLARIADEQDQIDNYTIPAKTPFLLSPYVTHRLPAYWQHPHRFYPEHFTPEQVAQRHRFAYLPFGAGPRQCIGNHFALMETMFIIAMMTQRFRLRSVAGPFVEPKAMATLRPRDGIRMLLTRAS